jgi:hypothetical protein
VPTSAWSIASSRRSLRTVRNDPQATQRPRPGGAVADGLSRSIVVVRDRQSLNRADALNVIAHRRTHRVRAFLSVRSAFRSFDFSAASRAGSLPSDSAVPQFRTAICVGSRVSRRAAPVAQGPRAGLSPIASRGLAAPRVALLLSLQGMPNDPHERSRCGCNRRQVTC